MSSEMKFVSVVVVLAVLAVAAIAIFGRSSSVKDPAAQIGPATLTDAGQLVRPDSYKKGTDGAKVTLVVWGDYQCPACKAAEPQISAVVNEFTDRISFVFRQFPLPTHKFSQLAATAVEAAGAQGEYWEMHDKLYALQDDWSTVSTQKAIDLFVTYASDLGLNTDQFRTAVTERQFDEKLARDLADAEALGVSKTPTLYVNGTEVDLSGLRAAIENALK